jgi:hypothetical protein
MKQLIRLCLLALHRMCPATSYLPPLHPDAALLDAGHAMLCKIQTFQPLTIPCLQAFVMHNLHRQLQTRLGKEQNVFAGEDSLAEGINSMG